MADLKFGRLLKFWRQVRGHSQESLALDLGSSMRHLVRIENGQSTPSEELIDRLACALQLGERNTNDLRMSAGYARRRRDIDLHSPDALWFRTALRRLLRSIEPDPALVLDAGGKILMVNRAWVIYLRCLLPAEEVEGILNHWEFVFDHASPQSADLLSGVLLALQQRACATGLVDNQKLVDQLASRPSVPADWGSRASGLDPRASYSISFVFAGVEEQVDVMALPVDISGPAAYLSDPYLSLTILYPTRALPDLDERGFSELHHPSLDS